MHTNFVQMPPDGVGKKIITNKSYLLPVSSVAGLKIDDTIQNQSGSVKLEIKQINSYSKILYCMYNSDLNEGAQLALGDNLYKPTDLVTPVCMVQTSSTLATPEFFYANMFMNVSYDNPYHGQIIDAEGQALIRFSEGSQEIDATGQSKYSQQTIIGAYNFYSIESTAKFCTTIAVQGGGTYDDPNQRGLTLRTTGSAGDSIRIISDKWHRIPIGTSAKISFVVRAGDQGKNNLVRRWGFFDDYNGIFLERDGTGELAIVKRSNTTGSVVDTRIVQSSWNGDKADGTGLSKYVLNESAWCRFWIDVYKTSKVRFGTFDSNGQRIILHKFTPSNTNTLVGMKSINLPVCFEQIDSGASSTSEMFIMEADVVVEDSQYKVHTDFFEAGGDVKAVTSTTWVPLVSIKSAADLSHAVAILKTISGCASLTSDLDKDGHIKFEVYRNCTLTGADNPGDWLQKTGSKFKYNKTATAMTGGSPITEFVIKGYDNFDLSSFCNYFDEFICDGADGATEMYTLAAKGIHAGRDLSVYGAITWEEIQI